MATVAEYNALYEAHPRNGRRIAAWTIIGASLILSIAFAGGILLIFEAVSVHPTVAALIFSGIMLAGIALILALYVYAVRLWQSAPRAARAYSERFFKTYGLVAKGDPLGHPTELRPAAKHGAFTARREDGTKLQGRVTVNARGEFELWTSTGEKLEPLTPEPVAA